MIESEEKKSLTESFNFWTANCSRQMNRFLLPSIHPSIHPYIHPSIHANLSILPYCSELCYFSGLKSDILETQPPKCLQQKGFQTSSSFVYMIAKFLYINTVVFLLP